MVKYKQTRFKRVRKEIRGNSFNPKEGPTKRHPNFVKTVVV